MAAGVEHRRQERRANPFVAVDDDALGAVLHLDIEALGDGFVIGLGGDALGIEVGVDRGLAQPVAPARGLVERMADELREAAGSGHDALPQDGHRDDRRAFEVREASLGGPERAGRVPDVELEEVVRQLVVEDRVLGVQPLTVDGEPAGALAQRSRVGARPALEQVPVLLSCAAGQDVSAALEAEPCVGVERDAGVRAIELLLDHAVPPAQRVERDLIEIGVAGL